MPFYFWMREGFTVSADSREVAAIESSVITFCPRSAWGQTAYIGAYLALALFAMPIFRTIGIANTNSGPWLAIVPILGANLFPVAVMEVYLLRRNAGFPSEDHFRRLMPRALVMGFLLNAIWSMGSRDTNEWHLALLVLAPMTYGIYILRYRTARQWRQLIDAEANRADVAEQGRQIAEMQLSLLQAQIEPHFLYNTLASVQYLVKKDAILADRLLAHLIRYLRNAMPKMRAAMSTLGQEFELADAYLQIANVRMAGRLTVMASIPDALRPVDFPPLILQTLIENALKHGVEPKSGPVAIQFFARQEDDAIVISVEDNGLGFGNSTSAGSGTGLVNTRNRLKAIYGEQAKLVITNRPTGGVSASIRIVQKTQDGDLHGDGNIGR
jgi:signal transduction histidine kinase